MMYGGAGLHIKFLLALAVLALGFIVFQRAKEEKGALRVFGNIVAIIIVAGSLLTLVCVSVLSVCTMLKNKGYCPITQKDQMPSGMTFKHPPITK